MWGVGLKLEDSSKNGLTQKYRLTAEQTPSAVALTKLSSLSCWEYTSASHALALIELSSSSSTRNVTPELVLV
jgi:hypothetical protein